MIFQRCQKTLSWSKGLNYPSAKDQSKQRTAILIFISKLPVIKQVLIVLAFCCKKAKKRAV